MRTANPSRRASDFALLEPFWRESVERSVLPNGLTLIVKPDRSAALASVQVWVKTGSVHEGANLGAGLSHYLEHMLFKGTGRRAGREISATVQAHGGYINAYTTFDRTVYYIDLPSEHAAVAIDLLADAVLHSTLPADEVAREQGVILREIAMTRDDPEHRLWEDVFATAFREHPYRYPVIGHKDVFSATGRDELLAYYRERYVPNNLAVVIVGDVDPAAIRASVERHFAGPRARLAPVLVQDEPLQLGPRHSHRDEKVEIVRAVLAWPIPGLAHPDAPVLELLATILGSGDSSELWREVRDKAGLVHSIEASSWNPGSSGLFCISFTCDPGRRDAAADGVARVLARCSKRGFRPAQLKKAVRQMVVAEVNARKTMSGQASRLGAAEVVIGDLDFSRTYFDTLAGVGVADLKRVMKAHLTQGRQISVSSDPAPEAGAVAAPVAAAAVSRPDFEEIVLSNGARLLLQRDGRLPNLHLRVLMRGGPATDPAGRRGASSLLATLLTKDTRKRSAAQVAERIEAAGGSFYPVAGNNSLGLCAEVLPPDAELALETLAEGLLEPAFKAGTLKTEREAQLAALRQDADDVVTFARKLLRRKFFGAHPLAIDANGDEPGVGALVRGDVVGLHRRLCVAHNVVLAAAGDFKPSHLVPKLKAFLARIPGGSAPEFGPVFTGPAEAGDFTVTQPREQAVVLQGFPGPVMAAPDYYVGDVADELLSGMASKLFERVREQKGLAYFVRSTRVTGIDASMFYFYAGTQPGKEGEVLAEIDAEIARVQAGDVAAEELRRCQARLYAGRRQGQQTNSARTMLAGVDVLFGLPANDGKHYDERVAAVTVADLQAFAQRYFKRELRTRLVVRP